MRRDDVEHGRAIELLLFSPYTGCLAAKVPANLEALWIVRSQKPWN
jgi:hypothetical protein